MACRTTHHAGCECQLKRLALLEAVAKSAKAVVVGADSDDPKWGEYWYELQDDLDALEASNK